MINKKNLSIISILTLVIFLTTSFAVLAKDNIVVGVGGWAVEPTKQALEELDFTEKTGIDVKVVTRPGSPPEFISQMSSAILGGTSPYDVIDLEDDAAINFSRAGWLLDLDSLYDENFWSDWTPGMLEMVETWNRHEGTLFRVPHNYETQYFFYRKDILEEKDLEVPESWEEMVKIGEKIKTDKMWVTSDGLAKGGYIGVYISYLTQQAGGNPYNFGEPMKTALKFVHDMIYKHKIIPISALNKDYDAVNNDYMNNKVAMMRMWPFFYDVSRSDKEWFAEDKVAIALPPKGPESRATYVASWGWAIPETANNLEAAKTFVKFMTSVENSPKLAKISTWFLNPRHSVIKEVGDKGLAKYLKMYSDAGVVSTRPFHPKFRQASNIVEELSSSYLTNQISLEEAMKQGKQQMKELEK